MGGSNYRGSFRRVSLSVLLATLVVTAGCSGVLSDSTTKSEATPTVQGTSSPSDYRSASESTTANATDLRNITVPENGSITVAGELDKGDPVSNNTFYEPVTVTVEAGARVNITLQTDEGEPKLRVRNPNGTVTQRTTEGGPGTARFIHGTFSETGRYTIETTSVNPNATFEYNLTIERAESGLFGGPKSTWNETEKYLAFGRQFTSAANGTADNGQFYPVIDERTLWANAEKDYLIIGYRWDAQNLTRDKIFDIDGSIRAVYRDLVETYSNATDNPEYAEGESWIPEVIYFGAMNKQWELQRTNYLTTEWVRDYIETKNLSIYAGRYISTSQIGPGAPNYDKLNKNETTTPEEFPLETYRNFTHEDGETHAEKYYRANSTDG